MDIIEEMRAALPPYVDIKRVRKWADALTAERDRLAAENAELRASIETISNERNLFLQQRTEAIDKGVYWQDKSNTHERMLRTANATLDRLREVVPEVLPPHMSWRDALDGARAILYPKETDNG